MYGWFSSESPAAERSGAHSTADTLNPFLHFVFTFALNDSVWTADTETWRTSVVLYLYEELYPSCSSLCCWSPGLPVSYAYPKTLTTLCLFTAMTSLLSSLMSTSAPKTNLDCGVLKVLGNIPSSTLRMALRRAEHSQAQQVTHCSSLLLIAGFSNISKLYRLVSNSTCVFPHVH